MRVMRGRAWEGRRTYDRRWARSGEGGYVQMTKEAVSGRGCVIRQRRAGGRDACGRGRACAGGEVYAQEPRMGAGGGRRVQKGRDAFTERDAFRRERTCTGKEGRAREGRDAYGWKGKGEGRVGREETRTRGSNTLNERTGGRAGGTCWKAGRWWSKARRDGTRRARLERDA